MRRGDIRTAVLAALTEGPGHGYDVIQNLEDKSGGAWRPSPGSIYPTLQLLEDEGLVRSSERDGKRVFEITESGRAEAAERIEQAGGTPWELAGKGPKRNRELRDSLGQLALAFKQITMVGTPEQVDRGLAILNDARKQMYQILAGE
jgi:DNA-binding PadR family transcriptional regulator